MPKRVPTHRTPHIGRRDRSYINHTYDRTSRDADLAAFYSSARWQRVRAMKRQLNPLCERCEAEGRIVIVDLVHHKTPVRESMDDALLLDVLESLCHAHHNAEHKTGCRGERPSRGRGGNSL